MLNYHLVIITFLCVFHTKKNAYYVTIYKLYKLIFKKLDEIQLPKQFYFVYKPTLLPGDKE